MVVYAGMVLTIQEEIQVVDEETTHGVVIVMGVDAEFDHAVVHGAVVSVVPHALVATG